MGMNTENTGETVYFKIAFPIVLIQENGKTIDVDKYRPDQARDAHGRWEYEGGGRAAAGFTKPTLRLPKDEYAKICGEISTNYSKYEGKRICSHRSATRNGYYCYKFENGGFGNYNIYKKERF